MSNTIQSRLSFAINLHGFQIELVFLSSREKYLLMMIILLTGNLLSLKKVKGKTNLNLLERLEFGTLLFN
jgi:hypothetical protein